jgi:hypothetical protein
LRIGRYHFLIYRNDCSLDLERAERNKLPVTDPIVDEWQPNSYDGRVKATRKKYDRESREKKTMSTAILDGMRKHVADTYGVCTGWKEIICRDHYSVILHLWTRGNLLEKGAAKLTLKFKFFSACIVL